MQALANTDLCTATLWAMSRFQDQQDWRWDARPGRGGRVPELSGRLSSPRSRGWALCSGLPPRVPTWSSSSVVRQERWSLQGRSQFGGLLPLRVLTLSGNQLFFLFTSQPVPKLKPAPGVHCVRARPTHCPFLTAGVGGCLLKPIQNIMFWFYLFPRSADPPSHLLHNQGKPLK